MGTVKSMVFTGVYEEEREKVLTRLLKTIRQKEGGEGCLKEEPVNKNS